MENFDMQCFLLGLTIIVLLAKKLSEPKTSRMKGLTNAEMKDVIRDDQKFEKDKVELIEKFEKVFERVDKQIIAYRACFLNRKPDKIFEKQVLKHLDLLSFDISKIELVKSTCKGEIDILTNTLSKTPENIFYKDVKIRYEEALGTYNKYLNQFSNELDKLRVRSENVLKEYESFENFIFTMENVINEEDLSSVKNNFLN